MWGALNPSADMKVRMSMPCIFINNNAPLLGHFVVIAKRIMSISLSHKELSESKISSSNGFQICVLSSKK